MLDFDLAELYGVTTGNLNKAVKRNIARFPERFMFQLMPSEALRFQNGTLNEARGKTQRGQHFKYMPYAFTEQGISMLSAVLRSPTAIQVSISIMDAFVAMRTYIMTTTTITSELAEIRQSSHCWREPTKTMPKRSTICQKMFVKSWIISIRLSQRFQLNPCKHEIRSDLKKSRALMLPANTMQ